jgi:hypothetical protein
VNDVLRSVRQRYAGPVALAHDCELLVLGNEK